MWARSRECRPIYILTAIILTLIFLKILLLSHNQKNENQSFNDNHPNNSEINSCTSECDISLVESISTNLTYPKDAVIHPSTYNTWLNLINLAQNTVEIGSLHWQMNRGDAYLVDSAKQGEDVFQALVNAGRDRGIALRIVQDIPNLCRPSVDSRFLAEKANAKVRSLNFTALLGAGALHTKLWLVDRTHFYVGSANMDWRSLTQVNELGIVAYNCSCMANDLAKIFDVYWTIGETDKIPRSWSKSLATKINLENPMALTLERNKYKSFFASAPSSLSPEGRTDDIDALIYCINKAKKFIYVSVRSFIPVVIYTSKVKYWPVIDDALKAAAIERKVQVKILISKRNHPWKSEDYFLKALEDLSNSFENVSIEVKKFAVPTTPELAKIPVDRVNHNKYMVTDVGAYIGTSNWSGDYFINSAGVAMVLEDTTDRNNNSIRQQLENVFNRDWNSQYAHPLNAS